MSIVEPRRIDPRRAAELLAGDVSDPMTRGALSALVRHAPSSDPLAYRIRELLDAAPAAAKGLSVRGDVGPVRGNPAAAPQRRASDAPVELDAVDVAWLATLPADPAEVSDRDARTLARLVVTAKPGRDRDLVAAHWRPVDEWHRRRCEREGLEATVERLKAARRSPLENLQSPVRQDVELDIAAAIQASTVDEAGREVLDKTEALGRARRLVSEAVAGRQRSRREELDAARAALAALNDEEGT